MKSKQQQIIDGILNSDSEKEAQVDKSLRAQAFRRAESHKPPKTMTPWEWEDWYRLHGEPGKDRTEPTKESRTGYFRSFFSRLFGSSNHSNKSPASKPPANCSRSLNEDAEF